VALLELEAALSLGRAREAAELAKAVGPRLSDTDDGAGIEARHRWSSTPQRNDCPAASGAGCRALRHPAWSRPRRLLVAGT
jgi:hypothetical protein